MYELIQIKNNTYYIESPAKIGLVKLNDTDVVLIDSGNDKDAGKKVLKHIESNGWTLRAIYNTHSNADHIGGNAFLQSRTGCKIYAPGIECAFTRHPILEPAFLLGAYPMSELRHKFLLAQESDALPLTQDALPDGFEIIPLPGHFFDMVGFRTPDDVVFLADCLSGEDTINKYKIGFIYDVASYLSTLSSVMQIKADHFVPSHARVTGDISLLAKINIDNTVAISEHILSLCDAPSTFEQILKKVFDTLSLTMTFEQYVLVGSTVRSYLSYLKEQGKIKAYIDDNTLLYHIL